MARPRKPTQLHIVTGNPGKRPLPKGEPKPDDLADLRPPAWLPEDAAAVWRELAPKLAAAGVLSELDIEQLSMGCVAIAQYRLAVQQTGDELTRGNLPNPWYVAQTMAFKQASAILQQFGMTPVARTKIISQPEKHDGKKDTAAKYF